MNTRANLNWIFGRLCMVICIAAIVGLYRFVKFLPSSVEPLAGLVLFGAIIASLLCVADYAEKFAARKANEDFLATTRKRVQQQVLKYVQRHDKVP